MNNYDAVYAAVSNRLTNCNVGDAIERVARNAFDISFVMQQIRESFVQAAMDMQRPSTLLKPRIFIDGNKWCALYGENLQNGVAGFGDSPELAFYDFDKNFSAKLGKEIKPCPPSLSA